MISIAEYEGARVASIVGEIDISNAHLICETLKRAARGAQRCIVSLERCTYCDTEGLAMLVSVRKDIESGLIAVVPDGSHLRRILAETGFDKVLLVVDTVDGAIQRIKESSQAPASEPNLKIYV